MVSRRDFCIFCGAAALGGMLPQAAHAAALRKLVFAGPPAPLCMPLSHCAAQARLRELVPEITMQLWRTPDILRTWVVSGEVHVAMVPANVAANLYNKGVAIRLLDVQNGGVLSILTTDSTIDTFTDLAGKTLMTFYRGDTPDTIIRYLATIQGMKPDTDLRLEYAESPMQGLKLFLSGRCASVLLPEPAATSAMVKAAEQNITVRRIAIQDVWESATGSKLLIPLGATVCQESLAQEHPEVVAAVVDGLGQAVDWIEAHPAEAARQFAPLFAMQPQIVEKSLRSFAIKRTLARDARKDLEFYYGALMSISPKLVGGELPDNGFYVN